MSKVVFINGCDGSLQGNLEVARRDMERARRRNKEIIQRLRKIIYTLHSPNYTRPEWLDGEVEWALLELS